MKAVYAHTTGLCSVCAAECPAHYEVDRDGVVLELECEQHGRCRERVESDGAFFRKRYEQDYPKPPHHLVLPITYRCNLNCRYCYTLSNADATLPPDRPAGTIVRIGSEFDGNVTLIGGEPTLREDLFEIIRAIKAAAPEKRLSLGTDGQLLRDP